MSTARRFRRLDLTINNSDLDVVSVTGMVDKRPKRVSLNKEFKESKFPASVPSS